MAKGNNTGAIVFIAILAVAALGLSGYTFVKDQFFTQPEGLKLVALWDDLDENLTNPLHSYDYNFLIEYEDSKVLDTNYVDAINSTRFSLRVPGFYKINIEVVLAGLIDPGAIYWVELLVNNDHAGYFERYSSANPIIDTFFYVRGSLYINNTSSENYYEILARSSLPSFGFEVATDGGSPYFNQLSIEYVLG
jgi:hypothetical protein